MGGRVLAVDYGRRRIGLAISDPSGTIATGLGTIAIKDVAEAVARIAAKRAEWQYTRIVVGMPLETSGRPGPMAQEVAAFVKKLERACVDIPVVTIDERFTSAEAHRLFHQSGRKLKGHKAEIDRLAAEILLRQYLDTHGTHGTEADE
ncbi:MAG: Holliday junction resolvase RuvX [Candidatus Zixiibacteriota bacterium]